LFYESPETIVVIASYRVNIQSSTRIRIRVPRLQRYFTGTGDLFSALALAWCEFHPEEREFPLVCEKVVSTVQHILKETHLHCVNNNLQHGELRLIQNKQQIENPKLTVQAWIF
jgi:pyridoxine kinase